MRDFPSTLPRIAGPILILLLAGSTVRAIETLTLRSGNGPVGSPDPFITMLAGPLDTYMPAPLTAADFAAARGGPPASIINHHGAWIAHLPHDPVAEWISTSFNGASNGGSAVYCLPFTVGTPLIDSATLDCFFAVDNYLGGGGNQGIYINEHPLAGSTGGNFSSQHYVGPFNVGALIQPGLNHLYVVGNDVGGPGGIVFSVTLNIVEGTLAAQDQPPAFTLGQAWPNPFNPETEIAYSLSETGTARLAVHDLAGREVVVLADGLQERGEHRARFDGSSLATGVYFYTLTAGQASQTRRMLLVK